MQTAMWGSCGQQHVTPECHWHVLFTPQAGLAHGPCSFCAGLHSTHHRLKVVRRPLLVAVTSTPPANLHYQPPPKATHLSGKRPVLLTVL